ncbi:hypothetical protein [Enhygromyxa salina]|uniref:Uncharacterized protein n=1 Tax=Enhygromyxa salina TaxID=215803 RepID=A0A2S9YYK8_9BACT|nr:hypothetical protein [Enhygromyxa salina]PRQ10166.1 hypothetical protein ENSA7_01150 [Enhygromyxa salina]
MKWRTPSSGRHTPRVTPSYGEKNYEVDDESLNATTKTYDDLGNIEQSVSVFDEFMRGAKNISALSSRVRVWSEAPG